MRSVSFGYYKWGCFMHLSHGGLHEFAVYSYAVIDLPCSRHPAVYFSALRDDVFLSAVF